MRYLLLATLLLNLPTHATVDIDQACLDCHSAQTRAGSIPTITGQPEAWLKQRLADFRSFHREGFPMTALAGGLTDEQIEQIAADLHAREFENDKTPVFARRAVRGEAIADRLECASCHGDGYRGGDLVPRLAGQSRSVLERQLARLLEAGKHPADGPEVTYEESEIPAIASFLHSLGQRASR